MVCGKCDWSWDVEMGDNNPSLCHKCGYNSDLRRYDMDSLQEWKDNNYPTKGHVVEESKVWGGLNKSKISLITEFGDLLNKATSTVNKVKDTVEKTATDVLNTGAKQINKSTGGALEVVSEKLGCKGIFNEWSQAIKMFVNAGAPAVTNKMTKEKGVDGSKYKFELRYWSPNDGYVRWNDVDSTGALNAATKGFPISGHIGVEPVSEAYKKYNSEIQTMILDWGPWGTKTNRAQWNSVTPTGKYYIWLTKEQVKHYITVYSKYNAIKEPQSALSNLWNLCGSGYNLKTNNCADATSTSLGINTKGDAITTPYQATVNILKKYPAKKI